MNGAYAFRINDIQKSFPDFTLDIESLQLERGFVLGLVGQNGAGKSTTLKILLNLVYPERGTVEVLGLRQPVDEMRIKQRVGYVSETPTFYEEMPVQWIARLVSRYYPTWDEHLYRHYLQQFGLNPKKKVRELSKGMRTKLALLLALSHKPELLILDEPTSGVDPVVRRELLEEVVGVIKDEQRTVVFSSHITQDVQQIADYVAILDSGRIVEYSDKETLFDRWKKVTGTLAAGADGVLASRFQSFQSDGRSFTAITNGFSPSWLREIESLGATNLKCMNVSLDEVLLTMVKKRG